MLGVVGLLAAPTAWAAQPRAYTFVSKHAVSSPRVALALRVPAGWECDPEIRSHHYVAVKMQRNPMTGDARWWKQHVLQLGSSQKVEETYAIGLIDGDPDTLFETKRWVDGIRLLKNSQFGSTTEHASKHLLGAAHTVTALWHRFGNGRAGQRAGAITLEYTLISISHHPHLKVLAVRSIKVYDIDLREAILPEPTWNEIVRSIRIVQK
jgi:hypothetical protein